VPLRFAADLCRAPQPEPRLTSYPQWCEVNVALRSKGLIRLPADRQMPHRGLVSSFCLLQWAASSKIMLATRFLNVYSSKIQPISIIGEYHLTFTGSDSFGITSLVIQLSVIPILISNRTLGGEA
jgi:hypothetical protein